MKKDKNPNKKIIGGNKLSGNRLITCLALSVVSVSSFFLDYGYSEEGIAEYVFRGYGVFPAAIVLLFFAVYYCFFGGCGAVDTADNSSYFFKRTFGKNLNIGLMILGFIFAFFTLLGQSYYVYREWIVFFYGFGWFLTAVIALLGRGVAFYVLNCVVVGALSLLWQVDFSNKFLKVTDYVFEKKPMLMPFLIMSVCYIPYFIIFYPGVVSYDAGDQIRSWMGDARFEDRHSPFVTFIYGSFVMLSKLLQDDNAGMFIFVLIQAALNIFAFSLVFVLFKKFKTPIVIRIFTLIYFSCFTIWPIYSVTVIKDSLFIPLFTIYVVFFALCCEDEEYLKKQYMPMLFLMVGLLMCLCHAKGILTVLLSAPFLIKSSGIKFGKFYMGSYAALFVLLYMISSFLWPAVGVDVSDINIDNYSLMSQQTARYVIYHNDEITEQERETLEKVFGDLETLAKDYNPEISDYTKGHILSDEGLRVLGDPSLRNEYLSVWFGQFMKHPATYAQAFIGNSYGYVYPDRKEYKEGLGWYVSWQNYENDKYYITYPENYMERTKFLRELPEKIRQIPGIGILYSCGFYTWVLLFVITVMVCLKKWKNVILCMPAISNVLVCVFSPVNSYLRYSMPLFVVTPILIAVLTDTIGKINMVRDGS